MSKKGERVRLIAMAPDDKVQADLITGDEGTVQLVDSLGTVHVRWDRGGDLGLIPGHDQWEIIQALPAAPAISLDADLDFRECVTTLAKDITELCDDISFPVPDEQVQAMADRLARLAEDCAECSIRLLALPGNIQPSMRGHTLLASLALARALKVEADYSRWLAAMITATVQEDDTAHAPAWLVSLVREAGQ